MRTSIKYRLLSPVSHIGETASTGSYFQTVLTTQGRLPVITGNSTRGQIRDSAALHLLNTLGIKVDKEIFNVLFRAVTSRVRCEMMWNEQNKFVITIRRYRSLAAVWGR